MVDSRKATLQNLAMVIKRRMPGVGYHVVLDVLNHLSDLAFAEYRRGVYEDDTIEDVLILEGERRAKGTRRLF